MRCRKLLPPAAAVLALALLGCGGHRTNHPAGGEVAVSRPDKPVWCPTSSRPGDSGQSKPNAPGHASFDARLLLGMSEEQAGSKARHAGCLVRVISRDGRHLAVTADFRANRVNLTIERGLVTSVGVY